MIGSEAAKLGGQVPATRPGTVERRAALEALIGTRGEPLVVVTAPLGYGKTTLLARWAAVDRRPFAWLRVDDEENDPSTLLAGIVAATDWLADGRPAIDRLTVREGLADVLATLADVFATARHPFVLVLDGGCDLASAGSLHVIGCLIENLAAGSQVVLSGRSAPHMSIAGLRARGHLFELGVSQLAMTDEEADQLLRVEGLELADVDVRELVRRTEGWPVAISLAARSLRRSGSGRRVRTAAWAGGGHRDVVDYLRAEHFPQLSSQDREFLIRTSPLDCLSGALCDAVLGVSHSARRLPSLERRTQLVVPLDDRRERYRYHRLYREALRAELELRDPGAGVALSRAAMAWHEERGELEPAIDYALRADDRGALARLVGGEALSAHQRGSAGTVERWLQELDDEQVLARRPEVAVVGAWVHGWAGRSEPAGRWAGLVARTKPANRRMPDGSRLDALQSLLSAAFCRGGLDRLGMHAEHALEGMSEFSPWRPAALLLRALAALFEGAAEEADAGLADACDAAAATGAADVQSLALAERAACALNRSAPTEAQRFADQARGIVVSFGLDEYAATAMVLAVAARCSVTRADPAGARADLERARALRPRLTHALPWLAIQARLELAAAHLAVAQPFEAQALVREIDDVRHRAPDMGRLTLDADQLRTQIQAVASGTAGAWASALSPAELRLLPLLAGPWSFREIADQLYLSRNTVKTEVNSIYRKLGVSSRTAALRRAAQLGLIDPEVLAPLRLQLA